MASRRGRGAYYKAKYGGGGRGGRGRRSGGSGVNGAPVKYGGRGRGGRGRGGRGGSGVDHALPAQRPPRTGRELLQLLQRIDRAQYGSYKQLRGDFDFQSPFPFALGIDHVQGDAYAAPSRCHIRVPLAVAGLPASAFTTKARSTAAADFLARNFARLVARNGADRRAGGGGWKGAKGGDISVERPGQHVLERTSVFFTPGFVEVRFCVGLPARGRSIEGVWATQILGETLPKLAAEALLWSSPELDRAAFVLHIECVEDQQALRSMLRDAGLAAFVANGAILPRASGASDLPMDAAAATPFASPESLLRTFTLPNSGAVSGMGIACGVALIVGGGFHGKSTLLQALEVGVYDHCLGDGREFVVCDASAVKIRAEDGRAVSALNITPFISHLPFGRTTTRFESADASGSTSQAANILEAVAADATVLLLDEDSCATNFMARDDRMIALVDRPHEPITPFIERARALFERHGVSSILVVGGCGQFFDIADTVVMMENYAPSDVTERALAIARSFGGAAPSRASPAAEGGAPKRPRRSEDGAIEKAIADVRARAPHPASLRVQADEEGRTKVLVRTKSRVEYGKFELDLSAVEQLVETGQTRAIADALQLLVRTNGLGATTLVDMLDAVEALLEEKGLDALAAPGWPAPGTYARPRRAELAAALNRLRSLRCA